MDKEFVLKYLKPEHVEGIETLEEIAEASGMEVVIQLYKNHETLRGYIPTMLSNKSLMHDVIKDNYQTMSVKQLADKTGLRRQKILQIIKELKADL